MNLRLYSFTNMYLSPMQKGIQTAHMAARITQEYGHQICQANDNASVRDWVENDETIIVLDGGNCLSLTKALEIVMTSGFPWMKFHEDKDSLNGALTCVGVVLPESFWGHVRDTITDANGYFDGWKLKDPLAELLRDSRLAV